MATASRRSVVPDVARFAVDVLRVEEEMAYVEGRWSGIRGMRFLRPTLVLGDRATLASLEHKPWAPREDRPWIATFPWDGTREDLARASLEVAPSLVVPLGPDAAAPPEPAATAPMRAVDYVPEFAPVVRAPASPSDPPAPALDVVVEGGGEIHRTRVAEAE
ncbi:MAG: hypothetical protein JWM31_82, partial [Solirubrobacterales bacterium]|nr:hypothetical protein [Solirubrobacterales bacterium]